MGNSQSNDGKGDAVSPTSPTVARNVARRKESSPALSQASAKSGAPPLVSTSSSASTATQPTRTHAHATIAHGPITSHSRTRSITTSEGTSRLRPDDNTASQKPDSSFKGNDRFKQQSATDASPKDKPQPSPSTRPVDVAQCSYPRRQSDQFYPSSQPAFGIPYGRPPFNFGRPPRLPLPIEEVHVPGSPITMPQGISSAIGPNDVDGLPRRASALSSTTVDDEDVGDNEAFSKTRAITAPSVPTPIEWNGPGEKVYVTGTFVQWNRKFKLHGNEQGGFAITLHLKPGTYHLKFLVDGIMITSNELPTTVDYTNVLVNYMEIAASLPITARKRSFTAAEPMPIPGAATIRAHAQATEESVAQSLGTRTEMRAPETEVDITWTKDTKQAPEVSKQLSIFPTQASRAPSPAQQWQPQQEQKQGKQKPPRQPLPRGTYTKQIPQFLLDLDRYSSPEDELFQRSSRALNTLPKPPSLPLFLGKSILNDTTPNKDDTSVLSTPNHTLLNHLATSSIKDGMLATSGTTRYKRKVCSPTLLKHT